MTENSSKSKKKVSTQRQGKKALRGKPIFYEEKKGRIQLMLTPTAKQIMKDLAEIANKSCSEWLEMHLRLLGGKSR